MFLGSGDAVLNDIFTGQIGQVLQVSLAVSAYAKIGVQTVEYIIMLFSIRRLALLIFEQWSIFTTVFKNELQLLFFLSRNMQVLTSFEALVLSIFVA